MSIGLIYQYCTKETFSVKLKKRLLELGLCGIQKNKRVNYTPALVELHNRLNPNNLITENTDYNIKSNTIDKYRDWINGKSFPDLETTAKICNALKVESTYFFTDKDAPTIVLRDISETLKLSPKAIENLIKYDSGFLKILDVLICTPINDTNYEGYTGTLEVLLKTLFDFGNRTGTSRIELITPGIKAETIADNHMILELLKRPPIEVLNKCLLIASQTQSDYRDNRLSESLKELKSKLLEIQKDGD